LHSGSWTASDDNSGIASAHWTLQTAHQGGDPAVDVIDAGGLNDVLAAGLQLAGGDRYELLVSACNHAGVCVTGKSSPVLVDNTAPYGGIFSRFQAVAAFDDLLPTVKVTFSQFYDPESAIVQYYVSLYTGSVLDEGVLLATVTAAHIGDEAEEQLVPVPLPPRGINDRTLAELVMGPRLFLEVVAVNGAGTRSEPLHAVLKETFDIGRNGDTILEVATICVALDCTGTCPCSPIQRPCDLTGSFRPCAAVNEDVPTKQVRRYLATLWLVITASC